MSKCQSQLRNFLKTIDNKISFPRQEILSFLSSGQLIATEFLKIYAEFWEYYVKNFHHYRQIASLLFIGLTKNIEGMIENSIQFIEGMIVSRLLMLIFNQKGEFFLDQTLVYLEATLQQTIIKGLQNGKEDLLLKMLQRLNSKRRKFNQIGFILEMAFIKKIQKSLENESLNEFNDILKNLVGQQKLKRLMNTENGLHFRYTAILRQQEQRQQTTFLQLLNGNKFIKVKQSSSTYALSNWIQQAFFRMPKILNLSDFRSRSVSKIFILLQEVQVFASSPLIQQFDQFAKEQDFLLIFQQFLMGLNISKQKYEFQWQKMKKNLDSIQKYLEAQSQCYIGAVISQMTDKFQLPQKSQQNKRKQYC